ncbi:DUF3786 domain-containing protein [Desulfatibacillum aliphaticivorans]|uniref:DUF3786 domain-containing protein n=1 Tax=Desulfatibacillum aliphaticivorans TaxID=218208 RepID=UPI0006860E6C|nr:DUF3786 domain-containing protein [Desulfatibacillum aliphaticivorans]
METVTNPVLERIYSQFLERAEALDFTDLARRLSVEMDEDALIVPYFDSQYRVSKQSILGPDFREPAPIVKAVLCQYLTRFPQSPSPSGDWTAFRDLPDGDRFAGDFRSSVEMPLARVFTGKRLDLMTSCAAIGGLTPTQGFDYDASMVFQALPHMNLLLLFNDADETFPAKCLLLFEDNAHELLDMETLSVVAWRLAYLLFTMSGIELSEE